MGPTPARRAGDGLIEPLPLSDAADDVPRGADDGLPEDVGRHAPTTFPAAPSTRFEIPEGMGICPPSAAPTALVTPETSACPMLWPVVAAPMTPATPWITDFAIAPPPGMLSATTLPTMSANDLCSMAPVIASAAMLAAI